MEGGKVRNARFRAVIALVLGGKEYQYEGVVDGWITETASGAKGFGYDPVFRPNGYELTFAEMDLDLKNQISHRAKAVDQLVQKLKGM
jgi:XTP/dITP diphosphohydrolase